MAVDPIIKRPTLNGLSGPGRPTKRTKKLVDELIDYVSSGAPFNLACAAVNIHPDTFYDWRRADPSFALQVDQAVAKGTIGRLKEIEKQGKDGAWQALSWLVERRHPAEFAKPEVALNIGVGIQNVSNDSHDFESVVVSDLEFLGLRQHENYSHRPHEKPAREVEATVMSNVPKDLSGTLVTQTHPGCSVVSESQAEESRRRVQKADARIDSLLAAKHNGNGAPSTDVAAASSGLVLGPVRWPKDADPSSTWWHQLVTGDAERAIEHETAIKVVRRVVGELVGEGRAKEVSIDFDDGESVTVGGVYRLLEELTGNEGWRKLLKLAEDIG